MFTDVADQASSYLPYILEPTDCDRCFRIGLRIHPNGHVERCPSLQLGDRHVELSEQGKRITRAVERLVRHNVEVDTIHFDIARSIAQYDTDRPCSSRELIDRHFRYIDGSENQRRAVTKAVRYLRDIWFLPVISRKERPAGYWIATSEADFRAYVDRAKAEPITRLSTIHRLAKANWPVFAEQLEIEFFNDMHGAAENLWQADAALEFLPKGEPIPYDIGVAGIEI